MSELIKRLRDNSEAQGGLMNTAADEIESFRQLAESWHEQFTRVSRENAELRQQLAEAQDVAKTRTLQTADVTLKMRHLEAQLDAVVKELASVTKERDNFDEEARRLFYSLTTTEALLATYRKALERALTWGNETATPFDLDDIVKEALAFTSLKTALNAVIAEELDQMADGLVSITANGENQYYSGSHIRGLLYHRSFELREEP